MWRFIQDTHQRQFQNMRFVTNMAWYLYFTNKAKKSALSGTEVARFKLCQLLLTEHVPSNQNLTNELKSGAQAH